MTLLSTCFTAAVNISCPMAQKIELLGQGYMDIGTGTGGQKQGQKNRDRGTGTGTRTGRPQRVLRSQKKQLVMSLMLMQGEFGNGVARRTS